MSIKINSNAPRQYDHSQLKTSMEKIMQESGNLTLNTKNVNMSRPFGGPKVCGTRYFENCMGLAKAKLNNIINLVHTWPPVYTPLNLDIRHVVFVCFMLSLFCAHAATDSFTACMIIPFLVLMSHIYFHYLLILLVTFDVSSNQ